MMLQLIYKYILSPLLFKWGKPTPIKTFLREISHWYARCQTGPSSRKTTAAFTSSRSTLSLTNKHINKPSSISLKNYQKNTNIFSTLKEPIPNSKTLSAQLSSRFRYSMSTQIILSKKRYRKGCMREKYSMRNRCGQCFALALSLLVK